VRQKKKKRKRQRGDRKVVGRRPEEDGEARKRRKIQR
jgi:hypothetical protein